MMGHPQKSLFYRASQHHTKPHKLYIMYIIAISISTIHVHFDAIAYMRGVQRTDLKNDFLKGGYAVKPPSCLRPNGWTSSMRSVFYLRKNRSMKRLNLPVAKARRAPALVGRDLWRRSIAIYKGATRNAFWAGIPRWSGSGKNSCK